MHHIDQFLASYGYFAIFGLLMLGIVGPLIPDETILVLAGIAIHKGEMSWIPALLCGIGGSLCGISVSYVLGRTGVIYAVHHVPWLEKRLGSHLPEAQRWFERFGKWTLTFGYFIAGVRHFTALVAGTSGLRPVTFALYAWPGGCVWVACFLGLGYYVGEGWEQVANRLDTGAIVVAVLAVAIGFVFWFMKRRRY
ncbi:MAG TPA: DedA family protein [Bryobacteraceae bacterium]|nr:DedA family protein [Bryobacteraceae bacterium]